MEGLRRFMEGWDWVHIEKGLGMVTNFKDYHSDCPIAGVKWVTRLAAVCWSTEINGESKLLQRHSIPVNSLYSFSYGNSQETNMAHCVLPCLTICTSFEHKMWSWGLWKLFPWWQSHILSPIKVNTNQYERKCVWNMWTFSIATMTQLVVCAYVEESQ